VAKKKLVHFRENLTFPHLFQPDYRELLAGFRMRGKWHADFFHNDHPLVVEFGCGKGEYTVGLARRYPGKNFIGIDLKGARLWRGCRSVEDEKLINAGFIRTRVDHTGMIFGNSEVAEIWITFPDPQPGKERKRLTAPVFLDRYKGFLASGGLIHLKTDDLEFFRYTLGVIRDEGHILLWSTDDLYTSGTSEDVIAIRTYYENRWLGLGKKICYLRFQLHA
jgi:tRNA (guanine-N7-)-methyltransferase